MTSQSQRELSECEQRVVRTHRELITYVLLTGALINVLIFSDIIERHYKGESTSRIEESLRRKSNEDTFYKPVYYISTPARLTAPFAYDVFH